MAGKPKLNGSVDLLAKAMRQVFKEAVQEGVAPLREDMKTGFAEAAEERQRLRGDMEHGFKDAAEERQRLRGDMENGFAELRPPK